MGSGVRQPGFKSHFCSLQVAQNSYLTSLNLRVPLCEMPLIMASASSGGFEDWRRWDESPAAVGQWSLRQWVVLTHARVPFSHFPLPESVAVSAPRDWWQTFHPPFFLLWVLRKHRPGRLFMLTLCLVSSSPSDASLLRILLHYLCGDGYSITY